MKKKEILQKKLVKFNHDIFNYPFDYKLLTRNLNNSIENLNTLKSKKKIKLYILSGSTISNISDQIKLFASNFGIELKIKIGAYNKYYEEALFGNEIDKFKPDWIYIHTNFKNIVNFPHIVTSKNQIINFYKENIKIYKNILDKLEIKNKRVIINNFEMPIFKSSNSLDNSDDFDSANLIKNLNVKIKKLIKKYNDVFLNDIDYLSSLVGIENWFDNNYWSAFRIAIAPKAYPYLSSSIGSIIASYEGQSKKVLICDLDNTLWGGIIGDEGYENIEIGPETSLGDIFTEIQIYIKKLIKSGVIVAVVSKNDEKIAKSGFKNKFSKLKLKDFVLFYANWNNKSENILEIKHLLNIGEDSIVFIDDNKAELEEVKNNLPLVTTIGYQKNPFEMIMNIDRIGYFNKLNITSEDLNRNKFYKENTKRKLNIKSFNNYNDYLKNLKMTANIHKLRKENIKRATQLINKTNQFNLINEKISYQQLKNISNSKNHIILQSDLTDKFGENGIVSILYGKIYKNDFVILNWVMSCRVFKRELEFAIFDELEKICVSKRIGKIISTLIKNEKNGYIYDLFNNLNFSVKENKRQMFKYEKIIKKNSKKLNTNIVINE